MTRAYRKWYFATNVNGLRYAFDQIQVALLSCLANTSLQPHCIVDMTGASAEEERRVEWIKGLGAKVLEHRASLLEILEPVFGKKMGAFSGHWLRCDIPQLETEDGYVLYTDIDVLFVRDLPQTEESPAYAACGPEHWRDDYSYFNSGVMILNVNALRDLGNDLIHIVRKRLGVTAPYDDQSALNELLAGRWDRLPAIWNWKPYWGRNDDAYIIHFHGPKPAHARRLLDGELDIFGPDFRIIFERNPDGYRHYLQVVEEIFITAPPSV